MANKSVSQIHDKAYFEVIQADLREHLPSIQQEIERIRSKIHSLQVAIAQSQERLGDLERVYDQGNDALEVCAESAEMTLYYDDACTKLAKVWDRVEENEDGYSFKTDSKFENEWVTKAVTTIHGEYSGWHDDIVYFVFFELTDDEYKDIKRFVTDQS